MKDKFPSGKIIKVLGKCISLQGDDIDTDRIIPARFLKCVSFNSLGSQVFADDRIEMKGEHPFDQDKNNGASILVVNENFGCGSSREHAPQSLMRWGIRGIIGGSFAEIFYGNCLALGIPCATSPNIKEIQKDINIGLSKNWELNLKRQILINKNNSYDLKLEAGPLQMFLTGRWDATSQLISKEEELQKTMDSLPYLNKFKQ